MMITCRSCGKPFEKKPGKGRPPIRCYTCKDAAALPIVVEEKNEPLAISIVPASQASFPKKLHVVDQPPLGKFQVVVGNLGNAYSGDDEVLANKTFQTYVEKSSQGYGQVGFETVQMFRMIEGHPELVRDFDPVKELDLKKGAS
jgi:hypothetical protein